MIDIKEPSKSHYPTSIVLELFLLNQNDVLGVLANPGGDVPLCCRRRGAIR